MAPCRKPGRRWQRLLHLSSYKKPSFSTSHPRRREGFALIVVLVLLALITMLVADNSVMLSQFHRGLHQLEKRQIRKFEAPIRKGAGASAATSGKPKPAKPVKKKNK